MEKQTRIFDLSPTEVKNALALCEDIGNEENAVVMALGYGEDFEEYTALYAEEYEDYSAAELTETIIESYPSVQLWISTEHVARAIACGFTSGLDDAIEKTIDYLADEQSHFEEDPRADHIWLARERLRLEAPLLKAAEEMRDVLELVRVVYMGAAGEMPASEETKARAKKAVLDVLAKVEA